MIIAFEQWLRQARGSRPALCVIGAGPAGLEIARHFSAGTRAVVVLEAGISQIDPGLQKFCRVIEAGEPMLLPEGPSPFWSDRFPEGQTRVRMFGGTASVGAGRWKVPDEVDFSDRPWIGSAGWPVPWNELSPHILDVLQRHRLPHAKLMPARARMAGAVQVTPHFVEKTPTSFARDLRDELEASKNATVLLRADAVELLPAPGGSSVESVVAVDRNGEHHRISAERFVVAAGALETARLLLNSTRFGGHGPGNRRGFVGANIIDHATRRIGRFHPRRGAAGAGILGNTAKSRHGMQSRVTLDPATQRALEIGNHAFELAADLSAGKSLIQSPVHDVHLVIEQTPGARSTVGVDPERDANGAPLLRVSWAASEEDEDGARRFVSEIGRHLDPAFGRLEIDEAAWTEPWRVLGHHMGTARMARLSAEGVVDPDCRVFGTDNLYVAGGAVFPVGGNADPLLLILALARRLARHLRG